MQPVHASYVISERSHTHSRLLTFSVNVKISLWWYVSVLPAEIIDMYQLAQEDCNCPIYVTCCTFIMLMTLTSAVTSVLPFADENPEAFAELQAVIDHMAVGMALKTQHSESGRSFTEHIRAFKHCSLLPRTARHAPCALTTIAIEIDHHDDQFLCRCQANLCAVNFISTTSK